MESSDSPPKKPSKKKTLFFVVSLIIFILILSLISIEVFSIILIKKMGYNWEPAYLRLIKGYTSSNLVGGRTEDSSWGSWNVPNYEGRIANNCFDVKYKFNSYGARDKERSISGKNRTLVFGDSFVEGWGVDQDKILAADLERISGKEFLNFGNSGSGFAVLNEYILYRDFAHKYEHDAVLAGLTVGNDFTDNDPTAWLGNAKLFYRPFWKLSEDKKEVETIYLSPYVKGKFTAGLEPKNRALHFKVFNDWKDFSAFLRVAEFIQSNKVYFSKDSDLAKTFRYDLEYPDDAITATLLLYDKFSKLIGDKKKYVVIIASAPDVYHYINNGKRKSPKMESFKESLRSQGWQVIDTMDAFGTLSYEEIPQHFICDGHWSAKGIELAAKYVHKSIK